MNKTIGVLLLLAGCWAGQVPPDTDRPVNQTEWQREEEKVRALAAFQLNCPPDKVQLTVLNQFYGHPTQVGAAGCERRLVYAQHSPNWISMPGAQ